MGDFLHGRVNKARHYYPALPLLTTYPIIYTYAHFNTHILRTPMHMGSLSSEKLLEAHVHEEPQLVYQMHHLHENQR